MLPHIIYSLKFKWLKTVILVTPDRRATNIHLQILSSNTKFGMRTFFVGRKELAKIQNLIK